MKMKMPWDGAQATARHGGNAEGKKSASVESLVGGGAQAQSQQQQQEGEEKKKTEQKQRNNGQSPGPAEGGSRPPLLPQQTKAGESAGGKSGNEEESKPADDEGNSGRQSPVGMFHSIPTISRGMSSPIDDRLISERKRRMSDDSEAGLGAGQGQSVGGNLKKKCTRDGAGGKGERHKVVGRDKVGDAECKRLAVSEGKVGVGETFVAGR